jgi:hypothetical protein
MKVFRYAIFISLQGETEWQYGIYVEYFICTQWQKVLLGYVQLHRIN